MFLGVLAPVCLVGAVFLHREAGPDAVGTVDLAVSLTAVLFAVGIWLSRRRPRR
ncbi:hypothetical protein [Streptomyces bambusae]|uniref:hypothetical protein n=1 Tax=Streptomyces bambusae TaxID=1550616 RepID=UPI001CA5DFB0|nr:hypothetical protein [Streptomyces bambusae]